jgi:arginase
MDMNSGVSRPIAIIGAPSSAGAYAPGQERAPAALRDADLVGALRRHGREVQDRGDLPAFRWRIDRDSPRARNPAAVVETIKRVRGEAIAALSDGSAVLVLGGDCTTGLGSIAGLSAIDRSAGLVYLDLHADMNVPSSVTDGALDWMGLGHALDLPGVLPEVAATCPLTSEQVVLCGYSETHATEFEREHVTRLSLSTITEEDVAANPVAAADAALAAVGDRTSLAVHFDVDLVDFGQVPLSEHTGANQGIAFEQALAALGELLTNPRVRIVTVAEHNPLHGAEDGSDTRWLADALAAACAAL